MRIRVWAFLFWLIVVIGGVTIARVVVVVMGSPDEPQYTTAFTAIVPLIIDNRTRWRDAAWQNTLHARLTALNLDMSLRDSTNQIVYSSALASANEKAAQTIIMLDNGQPIATIVLFDGSLFWIPYAAVYITVQIVSLSIVGILLGHSVLQPLDAMSRAARQIASNDLSFHIPPSRVREVSEVTHALHEMRDALRAALTRQAELEQERRFFISAVAHDLRTPLFALRGYLEGLERGLATTPEKAARYIEVCQEKANTLEKLIADLFAYSRLEYLEQMPERTLVNFAQLAVQAADGLKIRAQTKHIVVTLHGEACVVEADPALLGRVLDNLLDNALRFTPERGRIQVQWHLDDSVLHFAVADSGPGIAEADLPHLFEPLYRGDSSRSPATGGAGLGLAIARRILQAHGGDLTVANTHRGAVFTGFFWSTASPQNERVNHVSVHVLPDEPFT